MKTYNRRQFVNHLTKLVIEFEQDHEEHTGVGPNETMLFDDWLGEIVNLNNNTEAPDA